MGSHDDIVEPVFKLPERMVLSRGEDTRQTQTVPAERDLLNTLVRHLQEQNAILAKMLDEMRKHNEREQTRGRPNLPTDASRHSY